MAQVSMLMLLALCTASLWSQVLSPFTAAEGLGTAVQAATQSGITVDGADGIFTTGDTTLLAGMGGSIGQSLSLNFSFDRGTNTVWLYSVRGRTADLRDTVIFYAVVKLFIIYQAVPLFGFPGLDTLSQMRGEQALPATFMNSDVMVRKLAADSVFRSFRQRYAGSILLGASLTSVRRSQTTQPEPWWSVIIGQGTLNRPASATLNCFVPASDTTGTAQCFEVPLGSVSDQPLLDQWTLAPNPATDVAILHVPRNALAPQAAIEICTSRGEVIASYRLANIGAGDAIALPVSSLANGVYLVRYHTSHTRQTLLLVVSR